MRLVSNLSTKFIELYGIAGLQKDLPQYNVPFRRDIGLYWLCVMFTIIRMEHIMPINQPLALVLPCHQSVESVTNGHFISRDLFIFYLNRMGVMTSKLVVRKSWWELEWPGYDHFSIIACKKWQPEWRNFWFGWFLFTLSCVGYICQWYCNYCFNGNLMVSNNILAFFL